MCERGSGAKLKKWKTKAIWLGQWRDRVDEPLGFTWVKKMKLLSIVFRSVNVFVCLLKSRSLSMVERVLVLNILGLSNLLFVSRVLEPPNWVCARVNSLI